LRTLTPRTAACPGRYRSYSRSAVTRAVQNTGILLYCDGDKLILPEYLNISLNAIEKVENLAGCENLKKLGKKWFLPIRKWNAPQNLVHIFSRYHEMYLVYRNNGRKLVFYNTDRCLIAIGTGNRFTIKEDRERGYRNAEETWFNVI
jgi:hypothetical protein